MADANTRLLKMAHKAAKALHEVGALDNISMREMDNLCLPPVRTYTPVQIRRIRTSTGLSQPVFARLMGVGKSAVAQWEQGEKKPSGPASRLLETFDSKVTASPVLQVRQRQEERELAHAQAG